MAKVSVITPVYNCEDYIAESMQSMLDQTYTDYEWIIMNDGSTDSTWDIVQSFSDSRIIMVDSDDNKKIPYRRNQAIAMASGKYICIHDGDDISLPNRLEKQVKRLENKPKLFCCGGWAIAIDSIGESQEIMNYPGLRHEQVVNQLLNKKMNPMIDPTTLFSRDVFLSLGGYSLEESIYTVPDMDLWSRAILDNRLFENIPEPLIKYRRNPGGMTQVHKTEMITAHMKVWTGFRNSYKDKLIQKTEVIK